MRWFTLFISFAIAESNWASMWVWVRLGLVGAVWVLCGGSTLDAPGHLRLPTFCSDNPDHGTSASNGAITFADEVPVRFQVSSKVHTLFPSAIHLVPKFAWHNMHYSPAEFWEACVAAWSRE